MPSIGRSALTILEYVIVDTDKEDYLSFQQLRSVASKARIGRTSAKSTISEQLRRRIERQGSKRIQGLRPDFDPRCKERKIIVSCDRTISYLEIQAHIEKVATGFRGAISEGAPVAVMLRSDFALFEVAVGAGTLGSPIVAINWHLKGEEVGYSGMAKALPSKRGLTSEQTFKIDIKRGV